MKSINIVTYCTYKSLGSILQAFGLKKTLMELGLESKILMDRKENLPRKEKIVSVKTLFKYLFNKLIKNKINSSYNKRIEFIEKNLNIKYFDSYTEYSHYSKTESDSLFISGSDQVWHPDNCNPVFFLDFIENKKRISYAASMGKTSVNNDKKEIFSKFVNNFDAISVREDECFDVIKQFTNKDVEVHIDPTFLISADEWRKISSPYKIKEPYILLYMLYWDDSYRDKIKSLKKKTGYMVYAISDGLSKVYADKFLYDVGVEEFLWLIDHAEYVITSSFHGCAFSTIFNKKYSAIVNPKAPSRIKNLLRKLAVVTVDIEDLAMCNDFNYEKTNQLIELERKKSIEYLRREIE